MAWFRRDIKRSWLVGKGLVLLLFPRLAGNNLSILRNSVIFNKLLN